MVRETRTTAVAFIEAEYVFRETRTTAEANKPHNIVSMTTKIISLKKVIVNFIPLNKIINHMWVVLNDPEQIKTFSVLKLEGYEAWVTDSYYIVIENFRNAWTIAEIDFEKFSFPFGGQVGGYVWDSFGYGWYIWKEENGPDDTGLRFK